MNLILTSRCQKGCSFCFTDDENKLIHNEMSYENVKKIMDQFFTNLTTTKNIKLLGGEPTQHSQFIEILQLVLSYKMVHVNLISNFLFSHTIQERLIDILNHPNNKRRIHFLVNGMEIDEKNRFKRFQKNLTAINQNIYGEPLTLAVTVSTDRSLKYHQEYSKYLLENFSFTNLRLGLNLSTKALIHNYEMGDIIYYYFIEMYKKRGILINTDCQVPLCIFRPNILKTHFLDEINQMMRGGLEYSCNTNGVREIMPDMSVMFCYQVTDKIENLPNVFDFQDEREMVKRFRKAYHKEEGKYELYDECAECIYYPHTCQSLCLGCQA
jgi:organic radical activating enzyme